MLLLGIYFYFYLCSIYFTFIYVDTSYINIRDKKAPTP